MQLFYDLCEEQIFMNIRPNDVKQRKRQRKVENEVSDLKLKLSQSNKNIVLSNREIRLLRYHQRYKIQWNNFIYYESLCRYLDLTEEEKEKLKGSYKVARKLEKLENLGQNRDNSDSDDEDGNEEYPSLDSYTSDNSLPGKNRLYRLFFTNNLP